MLDIQAHPAIQGTDGTWKAAIQHHSHAHGQRNEWFRVQLRSLLFPGYACHCSYPKWCRFTISDMAKKSALARLTKLSHLNTPQADADFETLLYDLSRYVFSTRCCSRNKATSLRETLMAAWWTKLAAALTLPSADLMLLPTSKASSGRKSRKGKQKVRKSKAVLIVHLIRHGNVSGPLLQTCTFLISCRSSST